MQLIIRDLIYRSPHKLIHDLVTGMGVENSRKLFMWIPSGQYEFCPEGKIDNTHLNIYMVDV